MPNCPPTHRTGNMGDVCVSIQELLEVLSRSEALEQFLDGDTDVAHVACAMHWGTIGHTCIYMYIYIYITRNPYKKQQICG